MSHTLQAPSHNIITVDFGGTDSKVALFDGRLRQIGETQRIGTNPEQSPQQWSKRVSDIAKTKGWEFNYAGISAPSALNFDGVMLNPPNLRHPNWNRCNLAEIFFEITKKRAVVSNDGDCASYFTHQSHFGQDSNSKVSCFRGIGTGLAGALNIEGKVFRGRSGVSSEAGHTRSAHMDFLPACLKTNWEGRTDKGRIKDEELFCRTGTTLLFQHLASLQPSHPISSKIKSIGLDDTSKMLFEFARDNKEAKEILTLSLIHI